MTVVGVAVDAGWAVPVACASSCSRLVNKQVRFHCPFRYYDYLVISTWLWLFVDDIRFVEVGLTNNTSVHRRH